MRSDSKIPPIWTIVNDREYIWWLESRYSWWHKRNFITVRCTKCWLVRQIESKWFWIYWCRCNQLASIKPKHWFRKKWERNRFYEIYAWIKRRCNPNSDFAKKWYKWIKCEWKTFEEFRDDMYESYVDHVSKFWEKQTTIDRINNNWNYCKENCRWATCSEQNKNRGITNHITINWKDYTAWELAEETWLSRIQASWRISGVLSGKQKKEWILKKKVLRMRA